MRNRPSRDEVYLRIAETIAELSTCERKQVGAVVVSPNGDVWLGYNGAPKDFINACARPDEPGNCGCVHAEINAALKAPGTTPGKTLYCTLSPCVTCASAILNAGISRVVVRSIYRRRDGYDLLTDAGVEVTLLERDEDPNQLTLALPTRPPRDPVWDGPARLG